MIVNLEFSVVVWQNTVKLMRPVFYPKFSSDPLHKEKFRTSSPKTVVVVINIQNRPQKVMSTKIQTMFLPVS